MQIYENLKFFRENNNETQNDIAELLNTTQTQYWKYEKGRQEIPVRHIITLAEHYNISADEILGLKPIERILTTESVYIVEIYNKLNEKRKGKAELLLEQLLEQQEEENAKVKEIA